MPMIKARPNRVHVLRHICRLNEPNRNTLVLYARFIGDTADYVLSQLIETTIGRDRDFLAWREAHSTETPSAPGGRSSRAGLGEPIGRPAMNARLVDARFVISLALAFTPGPGRSTTRSWA